LAGGGWQVADGLWQVAGGGVVGGPDKNCIWWNQCDRSRSNRESYL